MRNTVARGGGRPWGRLPAPPPLRSAADSDVGETGLLRVALLGKRNARNNVEVAGVVSAGRRAANAGGRPKTSLRHAATHT